MTNVKDTNMMVVVRKEPAVNLLTENYILIEAGTQLAKVMTFCIL